ncbi:hypothetical protein [Micromonospora haikouensis]|uniref:hypothetical protein n=1 Tax=Micromonospora haikouensis TaxID=686309 RepID=UPI003D74CF4D
MASIGTSVPAADALFAASGPATPSIAPRPNSSGCFDELRTRLKQYAARRNSPRAAVLSDQADVDRVLSRAGAHIPTSALPRGLSPETAELVERALREHPGRLSAAECADRVGISRVSARRYLEHYSDTGRAEVSLRYGVAGRPERRYRWAG